MVTFSHIDYNDALIIGKKQEKIMKKLWKLKILTLYGIVKKYKIKFFLYYDDCKNGLFFFLKSYGIFLHDHRKPLFHLQRQNNLFYTFYKIIIIT